MGTEDISDKDFIAVLKDELAHTRGLYEQALREVDTLKLRNRELQVAIKEVMSE